MDKDSECNALRQVLEERCPGAKFRGDDIKKLMDAGYDTETALAAASKDSLDRILPTRPGVVDVLVKSFSQPARTPLGTEETPARAILTPQEHDESVVPAMLTWALSLYLGPAVSEMSTSIRIGGFLLDVFYLCDLITKVSQEQFMLIDLETVAASPFPLPEGFQYFRAWSIEMLEGSFYTPMSDMYQLGRLLKKDVHWMTEISESALQFIRKLTSKKCTAAMALSDPWLSDPIL
ncbi:unnamed protein product [Sphagnum jensenii]|uniref:UBA domain-containing protein n=1 Tax=Sphagnum jensenii TaxID=128206 RepID=A0ABP0X6U4_9BRYO